MVTTPTRQPVVTRPIVVMKVSKASASTSAWGHIDRDRSTANRMSTGGSVGTTNCSVNASAHAPRPRCSTVMAPDGSLLVTVIDPVSWPGAMGR